MATPTKDNLVEGNLVMHDHSESDLGGVLDSRYVNVDGDTMTGDLTMEPGNAVEFDAVSLIKYSSDHAALYVQAQSIANGNIAFPNSISFSANTGEDGGGNWTSAFSLGVNNDVVFQAQEGEVLFEDEDGTGYGFRNEALGLNRGYLDFSNVASSDKTYTFPNETGEVALTSTAKRFAFMMG